MRKNRFPKIKKATTLGVLPFIFSLLFFLLLPYHSEATPFLFDKLVIYIKDAASNEPIIGANIYTENLSFSTVSDENGKAILEGLKYRDIVIISYIGYKPLQLPLYQIRRMQGQIQMEEDAIELNGVEVIGRRDDRVEEVPYQLEKISRKEIAYLNAQTSAEILEKNGGLFVQKSQMGGGSPVIRGFEANRILLVVDGVRMNNAIYRGGHLQNSITVDPSMLEQAEVIYGPGSLNYGSDALGGVIHFRSKDPKLADGNEKQFSETNVSMRYAYANSEKRFHVDYNQGTKKWGSFSSFSFVDFDNLIAGDVRPADFPNFGLQKFYATNLDDNSSSERRANLRHPNKQWGTEYAQMDFMQKIKFQPTEDLSVIANIQYSSTTNIPRYDNLSDTLGSADDLKWVDWYYGPQKRVMASLKTRILNTSLFDKGTIIAAFQQIDEDQYQRRWGKTWRNSTETDVFVYSFTADFDKFLDKQKQLELSYGLDWSYNYVKAIAYNKNIRNQDILLVGSDIITRYPSQGSHMSHYGGYLNMIWKTKDERLSAQAGARYSYVTVNSKFGASDPIKWPQNYIDGIEAKNSALTYAGGLTYNTTSKWQFRALASTAFRAPNVDDFSKIREQNGFITVPNPDLKPEKTFTFEGTLAKEFGGIHIEPQTRVRSGISLKLSTTVFRTYLTDALTRQNFYLPDGTNMFEKDDKFLEIQANVNREIATIEGISGNVAFNIADKLILSSSANLTKGTSVFKEVIQDILVDTIVPFGHIPPFYGKTSLTYQSSKLKLSAVVRYNGRKHLKDYAITSANFNSQGVLVFDRNGSEDNIESTPYGFIDVNGNVCVPSEARGNSVCALGQAGALAWTTYNFHGDYQFTERFAINFAVENILDIHYRTFASGVSAAGRNFVLGVRAKF